MKNKILAFLLTLCLVMAMATCFATSSSGEQAFIDSLESNLTAGNLWGSLAPYATLITGLVIFGFALYELRKVIRGARTGKPKI